MGTPQMLPMRLGMFTYPSAALYFQMLRYATQFNCALQTCNGAANGLILAWTKATWLWSKLAVAKVSWRSYPNSNLESSVNLGSVTLTNRTNGSSALLKRHSHCIDLVQPTQRVQLMKLTIRFPIGFICKLTKTTRSLPEVPHQLNLNRTWLQDVVIRRRVNKKYIISPLKVHCLMPRAVMV